jgi:hypothetical protein
LIQNSFQKKLILQRLKVLLEKGYSKAAKRRAENEISEIDLKILTIDELPKFVGFHAVMKLGPIDCFFEVHPKWIVNAKNPTIDVLAKIYPNKYDWNEAVKNHEYIYGRILPQIDENHQVPNDFQFDDVLKQINNALFEKNPNLKVISFSALVDLDGKPVIMHECKMDNYSEYLAVATFDGYSVIFGLVTPNNKADINLEALRFTVSQIKTIFTRIPGLPNFSEMFFPFNENNFVKKENKTE